MILNKKRESKDFFHETQVVRLLDNLVSALMALRTKGITHGALNLTNIYLGSDGSFKLLDMDLFFGESFAYSECLTSTENLKNYFLSPNLLSCLKSKLAKPFSDKEKDDIYALGMIALELISLENLFC